MQNALKLLGVSSTKNGLALIADKDSVLTRSSWELNTVRNEEGKIVIELSRSQDGTKFNSQQTASTKRWSKTSHPLLRLVRKFNKTEPERVELRDKILTVTLPLKTAPYIERKMRSPTRPVRKVTQMAAQNNGNHITQPPGTVNYDTFTQLKNAVAKLNDLKDRVFKDHLIFSVDDTGKLSAHIEISG